MLLPTWAAALLGCALHEPAERLLVVDRDEGGAYGLFPREVPELDDPRHLRGELGDGFRGGYLDVGGYDEGGALDVDWALDGDVAVPLDEDGLILWSFYHHLARTRADLEARGYDTAPIFPTTIAFNPSSIMDFQSAENAAYATSFHVFVLFPEMVRKDVPLAANAGVVRHEFGHCWLHFLLTGDPLAEAPHVDAETGEAVTVVGALHEGFADTVATLLLDDPAFISASLEMPSRDVSGDAVATSALYPGLDVDPLLNPYDPYALGTVFASLAWDVRLASDPDRALAWAVAATEAWVAEAAWEDVDRWAVLLVEQAHEDEAAGAAACAGLARRFPHVAAPEVCP